MTVLRKQFQLRNQQPVSALLSQKPLLLAKSLSEKRSRESSAQADLVAIGRVSEASDIVFATSWEHSILQSAPDDYVSRQ
jgi:hypothetical protein